MVIPISLPGINSLFGWKKDITYITNFKVFWHIPTGIAWLTSKQRVPAIRLYSRTCWNRTGNWSSGIQRWTVCNDWGISNRFYSKGIGSSDRNCNNIFSQLRAHITRHILPSRVISNRHRKNGSRHRTRQDIILKRTTSIKNRMDSVWNEIIWASWAFVYRHHEAFVYQGGGSKSEEAKSKKMPYKILLVLITQDITDLLNTLILTPDQQRTMEPLLANFGVATDANVSHEGRGRGWSTVKIWWP